MRFDTRIAAGAALLLGVIYAGAALATGHSARSELPPDLSAKAGEPVDAYAAAALLLDEAGATIVDARSEEDRARFALPRATFLDDAAAIARLASERPVLLVAAGDEAARRLAGEARTLAPEARLHVLAGGARAWYLAFELPVPLFAEAPPPHGYEPAVAAVRAYFARPAEELRPAAAEGVRTLARLGYAPTLLAGKPKPKASGGRKKISGGCG